MCGIVGYIGHQEASAILVQGLKRLEYRGYDSAGVVMLNGELELVKGKGKVDALAKKLQSASPKGTLGIGHTRWATHGEPNDVNSHPHLSQNGRISLVHNGIIENYHALKTSLQKKGYIFQSDTDTEVVVNLIEEIYDDSAVSFEGAIQLALQQIVGTYGLAIVNLDEPDRIYVARKGSPLLLGLGDGEMFIASDASPMVEHTSKVIYLDDGEMAIVRRDGYDIKTIKDEPITKEVHELAMSLEAIEKENYPHFMLKEIFEQPRVIMDCLRGRVQFDDHTIQLGGLTDVMDDLLSVKRLTIAACGTSWHAALVGEYLFEHLAKIPTEVEYASEFRYNEPLMGEGDVLIAISQSGETADTLAALREAQNRGAIALGICNVVGSTIARETDAGVFTHAGPEIGVASTKAFTSQVVVLTTIALMLAKRRQTITDERYAELIDELARIPSKMEQILAQADQIKEMAKHFTYAPNFLYLGRTLNFPIALEGALKLKEISYIHAEGYPAAEMKHGPIALIDHMMPVVVIAATNHTNDKMISNIEEVRARKGRVIAVTNPGNDEVKNLAEFTIEIPSTEDMLSPLLTVIPLQLLSYYIAVNRGCDVDQPRNLAKSVTVE
ncbi:MAG: glutamine--fructose-6-phosphate transaminase (isomerizing) [Rhodothermaceae bacterium TMED105]|nr:MAG: glutamine--fructose-6-phosphate transaminase (isomerizing) [Rhodothermaceae bacterium TMED105]RPF81266.1 MAG: glutamine--fructose-6-phosphate transaminase (isomerizing) [Rhodothermaceae bacterium TMED105]|tara:strand:+ start:2660 stop:4495 length:1836 start_codon:yes stop_codon:yes gene_type:complete